MFAERLLTLRGKMRPNGRIALALAGPIATLQNRVAAWPAKEIALRCCRTGINTRECEEKAKDAAPHMDVCFG